MSAYNTTLHDEDDNEIYPKTLAENVYDGNTRMDQKVDGIRTDLGSPSSASAVTGADAFSKISTLNSDLVDYGAICRKDVTSSATGHSFASLSDSTKFNKNKPIFGLITASNGLRLPITVYPWIVGVEQSGGGYYINATYNCGCSIYVDATSGVRIASLYYQGSDYSSGAELLLYANVP